MKTQIQNIEYDFLFDLKDRENELKYFKMKNKYEHQFSPEEKELFQEEISNKLSDLLKEIDVLIIPETSNQCLLDIIKLTKKDVIILEKNTKENIIQDLNNQTMMKDERTKLLNSIAEMEVLKIANIAGNQRKRFVGNLFKQLNKEQFENKKIAFLDDSVFSGYTFLAANHILFGLNFKKIILFSKID